MAFFPHDRLGVVSLTNTDEGNAANGILLQRVMEDYFSPEAKIKDSDDS